MCRGASGRECAFGTEKGMISEADKQLYLYIRDLSETYLISSCRQPSGSASAGRFQREELCNVLATE